VAGPDGFFDQVYAGARGDETAVPWQAAASRPLFDAWYARLEDRPGAKALVVAAGLGDDAAALAAKAFDVTAFDGAATAVDWARRRHPGVPVAWHVADLLAAPAAWADAFDLVVEVFTVQSISPDREIKAAEAVRSFVAPGGTLLVIAITGDPATGGPPWPLSAEVIDALVGDLEILERHAEPLGPGTDAVRLELKRPSPSRSSSNPDGSAPAPALG